MTPQDTVSHRKLVNKQVRRGEPSEIPSKCMAKKTRGEKNSTKWRKLKAFIKTQAFYPQKLWFWSEISRFLLKYQCNFLNTPIFVQKLKELILKLKLSGKCIYKDCPEYAEKKTLL